MTRCARLWGLLAALALALGAQTVPPPASLKPQGYVNDFAHVLDPAAAQQLEQQAGALNQALKVQVAFVTVTTIGDQDVFDYSYQLAQHWGVGSKTAANGQDKDTGLLIFIAVQDHKYYTQVGYGLEPYITDADVGSWMRAEVPQLRAAQYGAVFTAMLSHIETTLAARMPGAAAALSQVAQPRPGAGEDNGNGGGNGGAGLFAILFIVWLVLAFATRGRGNMGGCLWPLIFMNLGGGGFGNRGGGFGGGWGGGFGAGGGGFGGFGGGGFGGGGAGGSW